MKGKLRGGGGEADKNVGRGLKKKWNVQFYFQYPHHFLLRSTAASLHSCFNFLLIRNLNKACNKYITKQVL